MYYFLLLLIMLMTVGIVVALVDSKAVFSKIQNKKIFTSIYISLLIIIIVIFTMFYYKPRKIDRDLTQYNRQYSNEALLNIFSNAQTRGIYIENLSPNIKK